MAVRNITQGIGMRAHIQNTLPQAQPDGVGRFTAIWWFYQVADLGEMPEGEFAERRPESTLLDNGPRYKMVMLTF